MPPKKKEINREDNQKPLFFDSLSIYSLPVNNSLPGIKIKSKDVVSGKGKIKILIPGEHKLVNVFLILNGEREDMYYQVDPGEYSFEFKLKQPENFLQVFYTYGSYRSESVHSFI